MGSSPGDVGSHRLVPNLPAVMRRRFSAESSRMQSHNSSIVRARSFGPEVPQDDALLRRAYAGTQRTQKRQSGDIPGAFLTPALPHLCRYGVSRLIGVRYELPVYRVGQVSLPVAGNARVAGNAKKQGCDSGGHCPRGHGPRAGAPAPQRQLRRRGQRQRPLRRARGHTLQATSTLGRLNAYQLVHGQG